jgi:hypothetical protein
MMRARYGLHLALWFLALAPLAVAGEGASPGDGAWESTKGPPAWVGSPAAAEDTVRGVFASQSNLLRLTAPPQGYDPAWLAQVVLRSIVWRLRPVLAEDADVLFDVVFETPVTTRRAYHLTPARAGDASPGAQTYTAWTLWEVPLAPVLEKIPEVRREAARKALRPAELDGSPAWSEIDRAPSWAAGAAATAETWTAAFDVSADRADVARAQADALSESRVAWSVAAALRKLLGPKASWDVGHRAGTWRRLTHRASSGGGDRPQAWMRFEIPMARLLAAVPEDRREEARKTLLEQPAGSR